MSKPRSSGWITCFCEVCHDIMGFRVLRLPSAQRTVIAECECCGLRYSIPTSSFLMASEARHADLRDLMEQTTPRLPMEIVSRIVLERRILNGTCEPIERAEAIRRQFTLAEFLAPRPPGAQRLSPKVVMLIIFAILIGPILLYAAGPWAYIPAFGVLFFLLWLVAIRPRREAHRRVNEMLGRGLAIFKPSRAELEEALGWAKTSKNKITEFVNLDVVASNIASSQGDWLANVNRLGAYELGVEMSRR